MSNHVWDENVGVLIDLVRIARLESNRGRVGELGDAVEPVGRHVLVYHALVCHTCDTLGRLPLVKRQYPVATAIDCLRLLF